MSGIRFQTLRSLQEVQGAAESDDGPRGEVDPQRPQALAEEPE